MTSPSEITSWEASNRVEEISIRFDGIITTLELLAERDTTETSSILWMCVDLLRDKTLEMEELSNLLMDTYRKQMGKK
jgi:hypothetical protein